MNPDPTGGYWTDLPITDRAWYPLYERMVELDVPAMLHTSHSCNPHFHTAGAHYINGDTTVFMQLIQSDLFRDFPTLEVRDPAWRRRGSVPLGPLPRDRTGPRTAAAQGLLLGNVFFDTCVYHRAGMELLLKVIPADNILFASEIIGAVQGIDPETGFAFDDTKRYIDEIEWLRARTATRSFMATRARVYPRLARRWKKGFRRMPRAPRPERRNQA